MSIESSYVAKAVLGGWLAFALGLAACEARNPSDATKNDSIQGRVLEATPPAQTDEAANALSSRRPMSLNCGVEAGAATQAPPPQDRPLVLYRSPLETGTGNIAKEKGGKTFVGSAPPPASTPPDIGEHRRRIDQYLSQWEEQRPRYDSLSPEEREAAKSDLKRRVLGR